MFSADSSTLNSESADQRRNAPPTIPAIRPLRTLVYLDFKPLPDNRTELTLRNFGYGYGDDWGKTKAYFEKAWPAVMASLEKRFAAK